MAQPPSPLVPSPSRPLRTPLSIRYFHPTVFDPFLDRHHEKWLEYKRTFKAFTQLLHERSSFFSLQLHGGEPRLGVYYEHLYGQNEELLTQVAALYPELKHWQSTNRPLNTRQARLELEQKHARGQTETDYLDSLGPEESEEGEERLGVYWEEKRRKEKQITAWKQNKRLQDARRAND
ncbi:MAG: hypothetical protein Q9170_004973 [Blastenia crenularia]